MIRLNKSITYHCQTPSWFSKYQFEDQKSGSVKPSSREFNIFLFFTENNQVWALGSAAWAWYCEAGEDVYGFSLTDENQYTMI